MMDIGTNVFSDANFALTDQFGRTIDLGAQRGRRHVLLCFYPLDFTPT